MGSPRETPQSSQGGEEEEQPPQRPESNCWEWANRGVQELGEHGWDEKQSRSPGCKMLFKAN